jgi:hypothetical protein
MANPITVLSFANMVYPTSTLLTFAAFVVAVLLAADWYVWGRTYAADYRSPQTVKPQSDFIERFLVRAFATNPASETRLRPFRLWFARRVFPRKTTVTALRRLPERRWRWQFTKFVAMKPILA